MSQIVMVIEKVGEELELTLHSDSAEDQKQRRMAPSGQGKKQPRNLEIKEEKRRRKRHAESQPLDLAHEVSGVHQMVILLDGKDDKVVFTCDQLFVVDVEFDRAYYDTSDPEPNRTPFGWLTPQKSELQNTGPFSGSHTVTGVFNNDKRKDSEGNSVDGTRPTDHRFYKATIWSQGLKLDPDYYCDR